MWILFLGSLQNATIRVSIYFNACITFPSKLFILTLYCYLFSLHNQRFEIIGLTGTFSRNEGCHVHISLADSKGNAIGGHLIDGTIFTTCELVLGTAKDVEFRRTMDTNTGYNELEVHQIIPKSKDSMLGKISTTLLTVSVIGFVASRVKSR